MLVFFNNLFYLDLILKNTPKKQKLLRGISNFINL